MASNVSLRVAKLAVLSESPADEAAFGILIEAVLERPFVRVRANLRARGWPSVLQVLPAVIRHLHFNTDAQGLVVVVDSDDSVVHTEAHDAPDYFHPQCRMCRLRATFRQTVKRLPPARGRERVLRGWAWRCRRLRRGTSVVATRASPRRLGRAGRRGGRSRTRAAS